MKRLNEETDGDCETNFFPGAKNLRESLYKSKMCESPLRIGVQAPPDLLWRWRNSNGTRI